MVSYDPYITAVDFDQSLPPSFGNSTPDDGGLGFGNFPPKMLDVQKQNPSSRMPVENEGFSGEIPYYFI